MGSDYETVDNSETTLALEKLFTENKVAKIQSPWSGGDSSYPFEISVMNESCYDYGSKKFRIYFENKSGPKSFIQSNDEGEISIEKLLSKAICSFDKYKRYAEDMRCQKKRNEERSKLAYSLGLKLKGTEFEVTNSYRSIQIEVVFYNNEEASAFVDNLVAKLKTDA